MMRAFVGVKMIKEKITTSLRFSLLVIFSLTISIKLFAQENHKIGGGYAVTGQISQTGYTCEIYNAANGLPTSDANFILGASDGYMWICGYAGVIRYDGSIFERLPPENGLTSGRVLFEDSRHRIWVGTNDNGVVLIDGENRRHYTFRDGLPSSSIRIFAEDLSGNVFIGTTSGLAYVDSNGHLTALSDKVLDEERILKLDSDSKGIIYGQTKNGLVFAIQDCKVSKIYSSAELGMDRITTLMADPLAPGNIYFGTESNTVYYGGFGNKIETMTKINVAPLENIHWISYDCGRVWISSTTSLGYLNKTNQFTVLSNIPMNSTIEMSTSDYQGNIWMASSTQGVMKLVTNNFVDFTEQVQLSKETVNTTCLHDGLLYIGADNGLQIVNNHNKVIHNELTDFVGNARIRCIITDKQDNVWLAAYTNNLGIICQKKDGTITSYTKENGLLNNQIRCLSLASDGSILAGTNGGLAVIKDDKVIATYGAEHGIRNTEFLTVSEGDNGTVYCGSDGDGIYIIGQDGIKRLGRNEGLSSDVVMRIKKDDERNIYWIITSNSIECLRNGVIKTISSIPYNNNYDIYFNNKNEAWILSSYGIFAIDADNLFYDFVNDYRVFTIANGLPYSITGNSFSSFDSSGNLYIAGREGVILVNMNHFFDAKTNIKIALNSIYCENQRVYPNADGSFTLPASIGRVKLTVSVLDYSLENPYVRVFLEGNRDDGITAKRNALTSLEYTRLAYGNYNLHVQILDDNKTDVLSSQIFTIVKKPLLGELWIFRIFIFAIAAILISLIVWRFMKSTIIRQQYTEIRRAKEEADRANMAKSRFLSNMSQEILTPINTILGMNEMIMREDFTNVPKGYFMSIMNYAFGIKGASQSLLTFVTDVLEMTKIETGSQELVQSEYEVKEMLYSILDPLQSIITDKGLKFDIIIDELLPKKLYGDLAKIRQVLFKLLSNAIAYTEKGRIEFKFSMISRNNNDCNLCFSVKDTGIGMKNDELDLLFVSTENQHKNLGLRISKKFAELMGGELICHSEYGKGSEFIFNLKQKIIDASPIGRFNEHNGEDNIQGPYIPEFIAPDADILVVDANQSNLQIIKNLLTATKVFVTTAESAEDGLEKLRKGFFNITFIDQKLIMNQEEDFIEKIREKNPDLPVYVITENSLTGEEKYRAIGYKGCISIPINSLLLERIIMRNLPEQMMQQPPKGYFSENLTEFPAELNWIKKIKEISVEDGIKNSAGISGFIRGIRLFYDTIDENALNIENAYTKGDFELYTAKIQMIKNSAFLIGALNLLALSVKLEDACEKTDKIFIASHTDELLKLYTSFKDKLSALEES